MQKLSIALLFGFFALGLYTIRLGDISSGFHGDEAVLSLHALKMLSEKKLSPFGVGAHNQPSASFLPQVASFALLGRSVFAARIPTAVFSAIGVVIFYVMIGDIFNRRVALLSTILFSSSHLWIAMSRLALINSQVVPFGLLSLWLLALCLKTEKYRYFMPLGALCALMFYLYAGFRVFPLIVFASILLKLLKNPQNVHFLKGIALAVCAFFLVGFPQIYFFIQNPHAFADRTNNIYILSDSAQSQEWREGNFRGQAKRSILWQQAQNTFFLWKTHDTSGQYGYPKPILPPVLTALTIIGILVSLYHSVQFPYFIILSWFFLTLVLGNMLAIDPFFLPRATAALPALYLFMGIALEEVLAQTQKLSLTISRLMQFVVYGFVATVVAINLNIYFIDSEHGLYGDPNKYKAVNIAKYLHTVPPNYTAIFLTRPSLHADFATIQFFQPLQKIIDIEIPNDYQPQVIQRATIYILDPSYQYILNKMYQVNPNGTMIEEYDQRGQKQIIYYRVD